MKWVLVTVMSLAFAGPALAQATRAGGQGQVVKLTVRPAAAPSPALKYTLLPAFLDRVDGDAAKVYLLAIMTYRQIEGQTDFARGDANSDAIRDYLDLPIAALPREKVAAIMARYADVIQQLEIAGRMNQCRWDLPFGEQGVNAALNGPVNQARSLVYLLALRARLQIAEKKYDQAIRTIQTALALSRNLNNQAVLIQELVSVACSTLTLNQVSELIQQPDAPNLYWALASLPRPFIDPASTVDWEGNIMLVGFPALMEAARDPMDAGRWQKVWEEARTATAALYENPTSAKNPTAASVSALLTATAARDYTTAKKYLISTGIPAEQVEKMPVAQVAGMYFLHMGRTATDDYWKWWALPFWQADEGFARSSMQAAERKKRDPGNMMAMMAEVAAPGMMRARFNLAAVDRQIAALQCVEALRAYAAGHDGKLPASLDELVDTPAPIDPVTGKPFIYRVEGKTAVLESPAPKSDPRPASALRYEITM